MNDGDRKALNLRWFKITDTEHPDYHPLFAEQEVEEIPIIPESPKDKGKGMATRPSSTDIHSPQDPEPAVKDEFKTSEEEKEPSIESPVKRSDTPMLGQWGRDLYEKIVAQQLEEVVTIDPGDFKEPEPEYSQLPKNTNVAIRAIIKKDPLRPRWPSQQLHLAQP